MNENDVKKIISSMNEVQLAYSYAKSRGNGVQIARDRMKNVLCNNFDGILAALREWLTLKEENAALDTALVEMGEEMTQLKINTLKKTKKL